MLPDDINLTLLRSMNSKFAIAICQNPPSTAQLPAVPLYLQYVPLHFIIILPSPYSVPLPATRLSTKKRSDQFFRNEGFGIVILPCRDKTLPRVFLFLVLISGSLIEPRRNTECAHNAVSVAFVHDAEETEHEFVAVESTARDFEHQSPRLHVHCQASESVPSVVI